ncbi:MAG: MFS transporter [Candidatus Sericytochromatia bacterium]
MNSVNGNILRFYIFSALSFTPFSLPVLVLFWQENGLTMFDVYMLQSLFAIAMVLLEVPAGLIADKLGKKTSLLFSTVTLFIAFLIYGYGTNFSIFLIAEILCALGVSLISGADSALLYDSLKVLNREHEYQKIEGRARAIQMLSFAVCNIIGSLIGSYSYRLTVYMSSIGPFICFLFSLGFIEVNKEHIAKSFNEALSSYKSLTSESLKFVFKHKYILWITIFSSVISGSSSWLLWMYQPYMLWSGLPVWSLGLCFASFNIFAAYISSISYKFEENNSPIKIIGIISLLQVIPLILMSFIVTPLSFIFILGQQAVRGLSRPVFNSWILKYTYADKRATVLSLNSLGGRLFFAITSPIIGIIAGKNDFVLNLLTQASILIITFLFMMIIYKKIPEKYFRVKVSVSNNQ